MNSLFIYGLTFLLFIGMATATIYGVLQDNKIVDIKSDSTIYNLGFRTSEELGLCSDSRLIDSSRMICLGFKEVD